MAKSVFRSAVFVLRRDLLQESRRKVSLAAVLFFAAGGLALISFSIGTLSLPAADRSRLNAGLLWVLLFFSSATGLPRAFVREEESNTAAALRKSIAGPAALAGKGLFNFALFLAVAAVAAPMESVLLGWPIGSPSGFAGVVLLSGYGVSLVSTFLSAIVSRAGHKHVLFTLLAFPLLLPLLLPAVKATALAADGQTADLLSYVQILVAYDGAATCGVFVLIPFVWEG
jgi:heme exporter protein B